VKLLVYHGAARSRQMRKPEQGLPFMNAFRHAAVLLPIIAGFGMAAVAGNPWKTGPGLHSAMPAGYEVVVLKPSRATLSLMGLIECPELEGAQHVSQGLSAKLVYANGATIKKFPRLFSFRITASLRKVVLDGPQESVEVAGDPHELLLRLGFRIRVYDGLKAREIAPESVEMIGMPAYVPYDERVYRVKVNVANLPITDRFVIEIMSPQGEVLTHFIFTLL
jgi:hypothetical protein